MVLPRVSFLRLLGAASPVWANVTKSPRLPIPVLSMGSSGSSQASVRVPQRTPGDASDNCSTKTSSYSATRARGPRPTAPVRAAGAAVA